MAEPRKNTAHTIFIALDDQAASAFVVNPTIAAGDFQVSVDGGAFANLATLPVISPAGSRLVKIDMSAPEMNGEHIAVLGVDVAGAQWKDVLIAFDLPTFNVDNVFDAMFNKATVVIEADGRRLITLFDDDGTTIIAQARIEKDGLERNPV